MTNGRNGKSDYEVGYRRPPRASQFKPGQSGNPLGRPLKEERALTERQIRNDILVALDADVAVQRNGKRVMLPFWAVFLETLKADAVDRNLRDFRARKLVIELFLGALTANEKAHPNLFQALESVEKHYASYPHLKRGRNEQRILNEMRRGTRPKRKRHE